MPHASKNAFRTFVCTDAARFTFVVVDHSQVVDYVDCIERTVLFADLTSNTANRAVGDNVLAQILGGALYFHFLLRGQQFDDVFGTCGYTFAASNTFIFIYHCNAVNDFDCAESTSFFTAAQTQTTIGAGFGAAASQLNSEVTIVDTEVFIFIFCFFASTTALNESSHRFGSGSFNTHDRTDFFSYCCAANGASVYGSCASNDSACTTAAAGETAAAAVSAGQYTQNLTDTRVFFNFKDFGSNTQHSAECNTQTANAQDGE